MSRTYVLGASMALTGPEAAYGGQMLHALELAIEDENDLPVSLHVEDDGSDGSKAASAAERLVADPRVFAVVGPMNSWTCEIEAPIYTRADLAQLTPSASKPELCRRGWRSLFRVCPNDVVQGRVLARVASDLVEARRVAAVHDQTAFGQPLAELFLEESRQLGMEPLCVTSVRQGDAGSFLPAARTVMSREPDAVLVVGLEEPCREAARALRGEGFRGVFLGTDAIKPTKVLVTPGFSGPGPYLTNSGTSALHQVPEFHQRFESRFGAHHSVYTVEAYDAARMLIGLLRRVDAPGRARILEAVRRPEAYKGLSGLIRFDELGERIDPDVGIYRCEGSELRFLGTESETLKARH